MTSDFNNAQETMSKLNGELGKNVVMNELDRQMLVGAICLESAVLLEGSPGTGKTTIAKTAAIAMGGVLGRVQGTSDQVPSDITGVDVYNPAIREFEFKQGPIFSNVLFIDEINRASEKTQAGLLQGMEERIVTINGTTHKINPPFVVIATQNPFEDGEGTFHLNKANLDRFPISIKLPEQSAEEMAAIVNMQKDPQKAIESVSDISKAKQNIEDVAAPIDVVVRAGRIVEALRQIKAVDLEDSVLGGARPVLHMTRLAQAMALSRGEYIITGDGINETASYVLPHRVGLTFEEQKKRTDVQEVISDAVKLTR